MGRRVLILSWEYPPIVEGGLARHVRKLAEARSLARMMTLVLANPAVRYRLVTEASEHVLRFDWADVARQTAAVYEELTETAVIAGSPYGRSSSDPAGARRTAREDLSRP